MSFTSGGSRYGGFGSDSLGYGGGSSSYGGGGGGSSGSYGGDYSGRGTFHHPATDRMIAEQMQITAIILAEVEAVDSEILRPERHSKSTTLEMMMLPLFGGRALSQLLHQPLPVPLTGPPLHQWHQLPLQRLPSPSRICSVSTTMISQHPRRPQWQQLLPYMHQL